MRSAFVKEGVHRVEQQDGRLDRADRQELRRHLASWFEKVGQSMQANYELTCRDFRRPALLELMLVSALQGQQPHYFLDWVLMPLVKKKPQTWLTEEAWFRWREVVLERRSL